MKVCDYVAKYLHARGVKVVFGMTGGMIAFFIDSLYRQGKVQFITVHHEQAAAFAAEGYGRMTGEPGVAMATSGPGATNLLTGVGSCYFDSSPALFITGQVVTGDLRGRTGVRQQGFQETDIVAIAGPIVKGAWMLRDAKQTGEIFDRAYRLVKEGRPGPVLVDVPIDIQQVDIPAGTIAALPKPVSEAGYTVIRDFHDRLQACIALARRPLVLVGGGVCAAGAREVFQKWIKASGLPVVNSLLGVDVLPFDHPQRVGMIGSYGNRWANLAIKDSDVLLVLGARLDNRQTGSDLKVFAENKKIFHVDCDAPQLNNRIKDCDTLQCDLGEFLRATLKDVKKTGAVDRREWQASLVSLASQYPDIEELECAKGVINPNTIMHQLSRVSKVACGYAVDVGQHQMWAAQSLELSGDQRFLTSGGMGAMGFALPAAMGMCYAAPGRPVVAVIGDGAFQVNVQELETVRRNALPIKIVVINNNSLGMVRQFQEEFFDKRYAASCWGYSVPNIVKVSKAYGIPARSVSRASQVNAALRWLWEDPNTPAVLEVNVSTGLNVHPKIQFRSPIHKMAPDKPARTDSGSHLAGASTVTGEVAAQMGMLSE